MTLSRVVVEVFIVESGCGGRRTVTEVRRDRDGQQAGAANV